jgi:hypothetical protein
MAVEEPPHRSKSRFVLALIEQATLDFLQGQVGFALHQLQQPRFVALER